VKILGRFNLLTCVVQRGGQPGGQGGHGFRRGGATIMPARGIGMARCWSIFDAVATSGVSTAAAVRRVRPK
jgi:hypothetical protein